jgi:mono/diheme cytochrome c family protein
MLLMTTAAYLSDRRDQNTRKQLARQAAEEEAWRHQPFEPARIALAATSAIATTGGPPVLYMKFCVNCHGEHGEGARQGRLTFPPLLNVAAKPRRTVDDIVNLLKDPTAYGLQPPMRSFSDKLTEQQMREIAEWIVKLKR